MTDTQEESINTALLAPEIKKIARTHLENGISVLVNETLIGNHHSEESGRALNAYEKEWAQSLHSKALHLWFRFDDNIAEENYDPIQALANDLAIIDLAYPKGVPDTVGNLLVGMVQEVEMAQAFTSAFNLEPVHYTREDEIERQVQDGVLDPEDARQLLDES